MRCNVLLDSPQFYVPKTLCKEFKVEIVTENGIKTIAEEKQNLNRAYDIAVNEEVSGIRLIPISNWGESASTAVLSFDFR